MNNIDVVYTLWSNLRKTASMDVGQVGFYKEKEVYKVHLEKRTNEIVNRLNKTKEEALNKTKEEAHPNFREEREERDRQERNAQKKKMKEQQRKEKEEMERKKKDEELRCDTFFQFAVDIILDDYFFFSFVLVILCRCSLMIF
ncbi:UNVERIFIED_CONTAM: hypothetical protein GTU68_060757 [Idotea baltica]|nr:hypothetical protein [Idotea baltica]